uniref:Reverse transcriptase domain-containing protein n=1 Tax=Tanacetum cinerariifolium TaxID=118510 RepID=A0A6L2MNI2_TANCI|nr:reverse transcriptase domain-containing protein [Tanacetum cinerariifolium]
MLAVEGRLSGLIPESIDSYNDLNKAFLENYLQQKKYIKDPIELHNIKQRDKGSTKDFVRMYKLESRDVKGAPECMRISEFVHGITNPELIKCLHNKIPKTVNEMMRVTTSFLWGEVAALNHERKKSFPPWKQHEGNQKKIFKKGGHNTDKCMHLRKQIEEMLKEGKLSHRIKEIKQNNGKEQPKSFSPNLEIFFPPLGEDEGTEGPMIIEAEIGGHCVHPTTPLIGFSGEIIWPIGKIQLLIKIEDEENSASAWMNFMVMRSQSPYNGIIGRPGVKKLQAVPLTAHGMLKILVEGGVITQKNSKLVPLECTMVSGPGDTLSAAKPIIEERVKVAINPKYLEQTVMIGSTLTEEGQNKLGGLLQRNLDIIAWKLADMTGSQDTSSKRAGGMFLDAYKGYHQIQMATEDEEKTAFITTQGIFCYTKMPFGLRNAGATYQHLVDKTFHKQIGRNLEVYVDDLVIKIHTEDGIVRDVKETFRTLRDINMKLNPKKCAFGVKEGMFLGYKVKAKGLKVCPDKVDAVLSLPSPTCLKDVQKLNGKLTSLNRALRDPELHYTSMEKLVLALVHAIKRLKRYFQAHSIIVITDQPIQQILPRPEVAERLQKWSIKLEEFAIHYRPRVSVKWQILADFIVERPEEDTPDTPMEEEGKHPELWILFIDGSSCTDSENKDADALSKIASTSLAHLSKQVLVEELKEKSIGKTEILAVVEEEGDTWMNPLFKYLTEGTLPADVKKARAIRRKFGLPGKIISDNGKQFQDDPFKDWCEKLCIRQHFASVKHPQTNGLVERANRSLREGIKARDTPFSLTYGTEAVIPAEIGIPTLRTAKVELVGNNEALEINLDLLEERREGAAMREAKSKAKIEKYYNSKVRNTSFKLRDLVYRNNDASRAEDTGKLGPKWEGPYEVTEALEKGAYKLKDRDGKQLLRT